MGNFDALVGEIARRRRNRLLLSALAVNWSLMVVILFSAPYLPVLSA